MPNHDNPIENYISKYLLRSVKQAKNDLLDFDKFLDLLSEENKLEIMSCAISIKELVGERLEKRFYDKFKNSNTKF